MNQDEFAEIRRQAREQAGWGFVSRYGRTGRIRSIQDDEKTVQIDTPHGPMIARVGAGTAIQITTAGEARGLTFEDLVPGMLAPWTGRRAPRRTRPLVKSRWCPRGKAGSTSNRPPGAVPCWRLCCPDLPPFPPGESGE